MPWGPIYRISIYEMSRPVAVGGGSACRLAPQQVIHTPRRAQKCPISHTPYSYAPGGKYVLFLDLLGFTAFVRSSFQKKAGEADDREKEFELAQKQFKIALAEVDREYRPCHEHLEELLRRPVRRRNPPPCRSCSPTART